MNSQGNSGACKILWVTADAEDIDKEDGWFKKMKSYIFDMIHLEEWDLPKWK